MQPEILITVKEICRKAGDFQLAHFGKIKAGEITDKGLNQLVSFVDVETEKLLVSELGKLTPGCRFITEEETARGVEEADWVWIIDPLDGTTNFLHGLPAFSISVALYRGLEPVAGVVYIPVWDEMFEAYQGKGAFMNGNQIKTSEISMLNQSLIATGFPYYEFDQMPQYLSILTDLMKKTHGLRRMGSAAIDLAYTACGKFDGFFELGLNAWDVAAGALIVKEAGGTVSDFAGSDNFLFGKSIIASGAVLYPEFQKTIISHFSE